MEEAFSGDQFHTFQERLLCRARLEMPLNGYVEMMPRRVCA